MLSLPTAVYSAMMALVLLFWLLVLFGGVDPDALNADADVDVDADTDVDVDADADAEGDAGVHAHAGAAGWVTSALQFLNVGSAPVSVIFSAAVFFSWVASLLLDLYVGPLLSGSFSLALVKAGIGIVALFGGLLVGALAVRPLRTLFVTHTEHEGDALLDQVCTITSSTVTEDFGQAEFARKGAPLILSVRCMRKETLTKGQQAVIVGYDPVTKSYEVGALEPEPRRRGELDAPREPLRPAAEGSRHKQNQASAEAGGRDSGTSTGA
jgi:hypothetical protein